MSVQWNVYESFEALMQAGPYHLALEGFFIACIIWLLLAKKPKKEQVKLSKQEEEELLDDWNPEPLVPWVPSDDDPRLSPRECEGKIRKYTAVNGQLLLNLSTHSYLNIDERMEVETAVVETLGKYGVGSCGPRGFYGTNELHIQLEERIANFYGCESSILYSYGFVTSASAIPAYSKREDVIFVDERVNFCIQRGLQASRSTIRYFRHNDPTHLQELLIAQEVTDKKVCVFRYTEICLDASKDFESEFYVNPKKAAATRKFLVVEGIYLNTGEVCPMPDLVALRQKYKLRLLVDESLSFGTMGKNARGITDHFNIPMKEVDLIMVSLEFAGATTGGFAVGTKYVVEHQRLSGLGYCFSASLPPILAAAAIKTLDILEEEGTDLVSNLQSNCMLFHEKFSNLSKKVILSGDPISPVKHLLLKQSLQNRDEEEKYLRNIVKEGERRGLALVVAAYIAKEEHDVMKPSIRLTVCKNLTTEEISNAAKTLSKIIEDLI